MIVLCWWVMYCNIVFWVKKLSVKLGFFLYSLICLSWKDLWWWIFFISVFICLWNFLVSLCYICLIWCLWLFFFVIIRLKCRFCWIFFCFLRWKKLFFCVLKKCFLNWMGFFSCLIFCVRFIWMCLCILFYCCFLVYGLVLCLKYWCKFNLMIYWWLCL